MNILDDINEFNKFIGVNGLKCNIKRDSYLFYIEFDYIRLNMNQLPKTAFNFIKKIETMDDIEILTCLGKRFGKTALVNSNNEYVYFHYNDFLMKFNATIYGIWENLNGRKIFIKTKKFKFIL